MLAGAVSAAPVIWNVNGTISGGGTVSGSFAYDVDTNTYSAINITTTAGTLPGATYTTIHATAFSPTSLIALSAAGSGAGQPVISLSFPALTNAGGTGAASGTEGACSANCTFFSGTVRNYTATLASVPAPAPVPTMSEWAMILFGTMLAGGAALYVQRRRRAA